MQYKDDMLLVKSIELQNSPEINDVIKNLLLIQNFSIGELYSYISKNLVFYEQENAPVNATTDFCPELENMEILTVISCTNATAILEENGLRYEFTLKNGGIENISISDKTLENLVKTSYSAIIGNSYTIISTIKAILAYKAPTQGHE